MGNEKNKYIRVIIIIIVIIYPNIAPIIVANIVNMYFSTTISFLMVIRISFILKEQNTSHVKTDMKN